MTASVLIVDDSLTVRMDLQEAFDAAGMASTLCATAEAARAALSRQKFGAIILDVLLPDADGVDLLKEIHADPATAEVPILLLSTEAEVRDRIRGVQTGADDYVGKPYDRAYLVARVEELLRMRMPEPGARPTPLILVIDDSATFREHFRDTLQAAGYAVLLAPTGEEGLRAVAAVRPDAVFVDAGLPGIDGATVIRRLKLDVALRRTPCILLTAAEEVSYELAALEAGADAFARKTDDPAVILSRLAAALRSEPPAMGVEVGSLFGPKRILAIDDSMTFLQELAAQVRQEGYDVILAISGEQALDLLAVQSVDCILLDLVMPGLSGQETCRRIKTAPAWRDIPLVMLTGREDKESMIDAFNVGADDYIPKSADFEVIRARVRAQIRRKHFEDENRRIREELLRKEREAAEARAAEQLAQTRAALTAELTQANKELEAFCYSVSHDLQAPLRAIEGFGRMLMKHHADKLDAKGIDLLNRMQAAAQRMAQLISDLLWLSRVTRGDMRRESVDLSAMARSIAGDLQSSQPDREIKFAVEDGLTAECDARLLRIVLENLLGNAWKFTSKHETATVEFGQASTHAGEPAFYVRDDGAGFDPAYAEKLFSPFQRLHSATEFEGTGIGLATVQRIIHRHGGRIWAEGAVEKGAAFHFTLLSPAEPSPA